jgi:hypothetical protein
LWRWMPELRILVKLEGRHRWALVILCGSIEEKRESRSGMRAPRKSGLFALVWHLRMAYRIRASKGLRGVSATHQFQLLIVVYFGEDGILDGAADAERKG